MADETKPTTTPVAATASVDKPASKPSKKNFATRVSRKIDKNTVEVEFGDDAKRGPFKIYDAGVFHGEGEYDGEDKLEVALSRYLPSGKVHDFAVVF